MKKKLSFLLFLILFVSVYPISAFAGNNKPAEIKGFEITSGFSEKENETTFDTSRTITGYAPKGTNVTITVMVLNDKYDENKQESSEENPKYIEIASYDVKVSSMGFFSKSIDLEVGENKIIVFAEKKSGKALEQSSEIHIIIRKDTKIIDELGEKNITLPGSNAVKTAN